MHKILVIGEKPKWTLPMPESHINLLLKPKDQLHLVSLDLPIRVQHSLLPNHLLGAKSNGWIMHRILEI